MIIALALAAELGLNAPESLKPCPLPIQAARPKLQKPATLSKPTHLRKIKTDCGELDHPHSVLFPEKTEPTEYTPAPATFAAALEPSIERELGTEVGDAGDPGSPSVAGAAAFTFGPILIQQPALFQVTPVPEPRAWLLILAGLAALSVWRRAGDGR